MAAKSGVVKMKMTCAAMAAGPRGISTSQNWPKNITLASHRMEVRIACRMLRRERFSETNEAWLWEATSIESDGEVPDRH
ncbi:hypothetical protein DICSQDRAFT_150665 [Dichomitus squalens LYAD-421 SS1]|uniref:Uncharacterized protein n=1 Tax=Dichomitus squalens (strain LYAD-421) TaxID=732165 RepID=R7SII3_DICSQ|nr:uncharacterized protein DICSQDRAFT_150665 [Dichomitus squalens LYAD-421 SS1]EJF55959.1 hypothetical protein DICSQDRAFT_150665 [Dichomitus squalens LYAD-421 SS1]